MNSVIIAGLLGGLATASPLTIAVIKILVEFLPCVEFFSRSPSKSGFNLSRDDYYSYFEELIRERKIYILSLRMNRLIMFKLFKLETTYDI